ncbi:MAG: MotA/TolQ/ExbB proton channel family protein [Verrucomicrobia bacterium]|nr:MotA/TolQ/ExbB proton channel family protein [Verrucomicrobiota bacterium]
MRSIFRKTLVCTFAAAVMLGGVTSAVGQPADEQAIKQSMSLTEIIETGGWLMYVLGGMSILGLAFVVYFLLVLRQQQITPTALLRDLKEKLVAGRIEESLTACAGSRSPLSIIATAALEYTKRTGEPDPAMLKEIIEGEGNRQAVVIQNQTQYLLDIAVIAPMVGLLGTVMGMLKAFNTVALDIAKAKPMLLAAGVSQALITTAAGLIVGIPAMIFYAYFRGRTSKLLSNLESASADLLTLLIHKK